MRLEFQPDNTWLSLKLFYNELAGFAEGKVPTGRWLDAKGEVLCNIAYEYDEKARVLNSSDDLLRAPYLVGVPHGEVIAWYLPAFAGQGCECLFLRWQYLARRSALAMACTTKSQHSVCTRTAMAALFIIAMASGV